jgi:ParB-like chromosome segregation protein Spo0J
MTEVDRERVRFLVGLMRRSIEAYRSEGMPLERLVSDVLSLVDSLEAVADHAWVEDLRSLWWRLEVPYASMVDRGRPDLPQEDAEDVSAALDELMAALVEY